MNVDLFKRHDNYKYVFHKVVLNLRIILVYLKVDFKNQYLASELQLLVVNLRALVTPTLLQTLHYNIELTIHFQSN